jgi:hypothetical protein
MTMKLSRGKSDRYSVIVWFYGTDMTEVEAHEVFFEVLKESLRIYHLWKDKLNTRYICMTRLHDGEVLIEWNGEQ